MRMFFSLISALFLLLTCTGCAQRAEAELFAMDTVITMQISGAHADKAVAQAKDEIHRLDALLSIGDPGSDIAALNSGTVCVVSDETIQLLQQACSISELTNGAYDCTIEPAVKAWGWYSSDPSVPSQTSLEAALSQVGFQSISIENHQVLFEKEAMGIDLGGIGKGYAAGCVYRLLQDSGIQSGILSLGGNIRAIGSKPNGQPWVVGIADPTAPASYLCTVSVSDTAVVTSGDYQRYFLADNIRYHHILDPQTGMPVNNGLHSVTIVCKDDALADGLSTALFVMGLEDAISFWRSGSCEFDAVFIGDDGIQITEGLQDIFQCQTDYEVIFH